MEGVAFFMRNFYTYRLTKGSSFSLQIGTNSPCFHNGRLSVWNLYLTDEEKSALDLRLREIQQPFDTYESIQEEKNLYNQTHCDQCASCWWFDISLPIKCGLQHYEEEVVREILQENMTAKEDQIRCPILVGFCHEW